MSEHVHYLEAVDRRLRIPTTDPRNLPYARCSGCRELLSVSLMHTRDDDLHDRTAVDLVKRGPEDAA